MLDEEAIQNRRNNYTSLEDMYLCFKYIIESSILTPELCKFSLDVYRQKINNQYLDILMILNLLKKLEV